MAVQVVQRTVNMHKADTNTNQNPLPTMDIEDSALLAQTTPGETLLFDSSLVDILGQEVARELSFLQAHATGTPSEHTLTDIGNDHFGSAVSTTPLFYHLTLSFSSSD
jgi:hypothetical protein